MKILAAVMALLAVIYFASAFTQRTDSIDGSSRVAAFKSAKKIKRYMTPEELHLFETSFWTLETIKSQAGGKGGEDAFLAVVDGKTAEEIVETARQEVNARIEAGDPQFSKYGSWENMVKELTARDSKKPEHAEPAHPLRNSVRNGRPDSGSEPAR
jgi:hypothetical protein